MPYKWTRNNNYPILPQAEKMSLWSFTLHLLRRRAPSFKFAIWMYKTVNALAIYLILPLTCPEIPIINISRETSLPWMGITEFPSLLFSALIAISPQLTWRLFLCDFCTFCLLHYTVGLILVNRCFLWREWCWGWNSSTLATSWEELTHWKRLWYWEGLGTGGEGDDRGWDGWMASLTRWTWIWVNSGSWWWTGRPGVLWFMGLQESVTTEQLNWTKLNRCLRQLW